MFDFLRSKERHSIVVYVMFFMIIAVFVLWGIGSDRMGGAGFAAQVNDRVISIGEYTRAYDRQAEFYSRMAGGNFELDDQRRAQLRRMTLEQLINMEVLYQAAKSAGFETTDAEIRHEITSIPGFQKDGFFQKDYYDNYLSRSHISAAQFESEFRKGQILEGIRSRFQAASMPTNAEVELESKTKNLKVKIDYLEWSEANFFDRAKGSKADLAAFAQNPENAKKIEEYYNTNKNTYTQQAQVKARHILIKAPLNDKAADEKAQKKIKEIAERIKKGEDFGKLAAEVSEDGGSKASKGDLGFFGRGRMVKPFEDAAFTLPLKKVSEPVRTDFGYHLIEVLEKKDEVVKPLSAVRDEIAANLISQARIKEFADKMEKTMAESDLGKRLSGVDSLAKANGLKWESTEFFEISAPNIPKIGGGDDFLTEAFALKKDRPVSSKILRSGVKAFVFRYNDAKPPKDDKKSNAPNDDIKSQLAQSRSNDALRNWQEALVKVAKVSRNGRILADQTVE